MARYTSQVNLSFDASQEDRAIIPDAGASVAVEFWNGAGWTVDSKSPVTKPTTIFSKGVRVRLTPTGGGFYLDEGSGLL
jgi:hypothetical protein